MIAIITARGGSKGLPRKNILPFCGKPLIAHTITAARGCAGVDRIIVSTDDAEIAAVSRIYGAEVPFMRPEALATDQARSRDVVLHALSFFEGQGEVIETFCLMQPTSPLRTAADMNAAITMFCERDAESVISVAPYDHPVQWAMEIRDDQVLVPREKENFVQRQCLATYYRPNGAIYMFNTDFYKRSNDYIGSRTYAYIMPPERSVDIDTRLDFILAETVAQYFKETSHD